LRRFSITRRKRLGDLPAAAKLFESVLSGPSPLHEVRLQLIDIYRTNIVEFCEDFRRELRTTVNALILRSLSAVALQGGSAGR
jgi:hypothetical protein